MSPVAAGIHHQIDGPPDGPPLVMAHGLGCTLELWDPQAATLSRDRRVIRYELPGHGASPVLPGPYTMAGLADDLARLLDALSLASVDLVGASIGGMIAIHLAAASPDRVRRMVLIGTSAKLGPPEAWAERAELVTAEGMGAVAAKVAARWLTPAYAAAHPEQLTRLEGMLLGADPLGYAACCRAIEAMDATSSLPRIRTTTLVLVGEHDPATPLEHAQLIADGIAGSRLVVVPDGAHLPNVQHPGLITRLIDEHLTAGREAA